MEKALMELYTPECVITYSGILFNIRNPKPQDIYPVDIAVGLARECRFHGGTRKFYSVAEHSVWCALTAESMYPNEKNLPFAVLLHDAHEYIWKDLPSPLKRLLPYYETGAALLQEAVHKRFQVSISPAQKEMIAQIDKLALEWEWENKVKRWTGLPPLHEKAAVDYFIHHFVRLCKTPHVLQP